MFYFFLFIIILYILFRLLGMYLLPWAVKRYLKNFEKKFYKQNNTYPYKKNGIEINYNENTRNKKNLNIDNIGEYVDFEENKK